MALLFTTYENDSRSSVTHPGCFSYWKISIEQYNLTASSSSVTFRYPAFTAYYQYSGKLYAHCQLVFDIVYGSTNGNKITSTKGVVSEGQGGTPGVSILATKWNSAVTKSLYRISGYMPNTVNVQTSSIFNSNNKTSKTVPFYIKLQNAYENSIPQTIMTSAKIPSDGEGEADPDMEAWLYNSSAGYMYTGQLGTITLNAPPTFSKSSITYDKIGNQGYPHANYSTASITLSNLSAKYEGYIKKIEFIIGDQNASKTFTSTPSTAQTLSIKLNKSGKYTPKVRVTDSRGQVTEQTYSSINVEPYDVPTVTANITRTNTIGVEQDEGGSGVITAKFTYTSEVATLVEPLIQIQDEQGNEIDQSDFQVDWYSSYNSNSGVNTPINDWESVNTNTEVYGLITRFMVSGDTEPINGKFYYEYQNNTYILVPPYRATSDTRAIHGKSYYEYQNNAYVLINEYKLSTDTVINNSKAYYKLENGVYVQIVLSEDVTHNENPSEEGWYEGFNNENPLTEGWYEEGYNTSVNPQNEGWFEEGFDPMQSYTILITPVDDVGGEGTTLIKTLSAAFYTIDFLAGGHGIALGQPATDEGFYCNMPAYFKNQTYLKNIVGISNDINNIQTGIRIQNTNNPNNSEISMFVGVGNSGNAHGVWSNQLTDTSTGGWLINSQNNGKVYIHGMDFTNASSARNSIQAAAASAIPTTSTITINTTSATGTYISSSCHRYGNIVHLTFAFRNTSSVASGSNIYSGTLNTALPVPSSTVTSATFYGSHALVGTLNTSRVLTIRNASSSAVQYGASDTGVISFTYICS